MRIPRTRSLFRGCALATAFALVAIPSFARDLYWTEQKQILASDIDGSNVTVIFDGNTSEPPMGSHAVDIAVTDSHIYWTGHTGQDIWRADRDGSNPSQLITGVGSSQGGLHFLALDDANGKMYFSHHESGLYSANLADGSDVTNIYNHVPGLFTGVALDTSVSAPEAAFFWLSRQNRWLYRSSRSGSSWNVSGGPQLPGGDETYGIAFHEPSNTIYYTNYTEHTLRSYNRTTEEHTLHHTPGMTQPLGVKVSPSGTHLLIAERGRGITAFQISNGGYEVIVPSTTAHFGVAVTADPGPLAEPPPPPPPPEDGDIIFQATFEDDLLGERPRLVAEGGLWTNWTPRNTPETIFVMEDEDNLFGRGTANRFLRVENSIGSYMDAPLVESAEVVTLSFEFIARRTTVNSGGPERYGMGFLGGGTRQHLYSVSSSGTLRGGTGAGRQPVGELARVDVLYNNSASSVEYEAPDGETQTLASLQTHVWINGEHLDSYDAFGQQTGAAAGTPIDFIRMPHFSSTDEFSMDIDNFTVFMGAHVMKPLEEGDGPSGGFADWQVQNFPGEDDPAIVGPDADPDGDGVKNLLEYALGRDPLVPSSRGLPSTGILNVDGVDYLTLTFTRPFGLDDVQYRVAASNTLTSWTDDAVWVSTTAGAGDTEEVVYRHPEPLTAASGGFLRLEVTLE